MATSPTRTIREVLLTTIQKQTPKDHQQKPLTQDDVLDEVLKTLGYNHYDTNANQAILTAWSDLFRSGLLAWGISVHNPKPPFFFVTANGRKALEQITRDPSNPAGYMRHLESRVRLGPVARSYIVEALDCYVAGLFKASAVMVGAAAESVILELRDLVVARLTVQQKSIPKDLNHWQLKTVTDALAKIFDGGIDRKKNRELRERYEMYWTGFAGQLRTTRNEAGHPASIEPVTFDTVHASLLIFPELGGLAKALWDWVSDEM